jgi:outer membrane protein assembly factor BamA
MARITGRTFAAFLSGLLLLLYGCNPARYIGSDQVLLHRNTVRIDTLRFEKEELESLIKQKPNRRVLGLFYPYAFFYHAGSKGKPTGFKNWLKEIGEEPSVLDTSLIRRSRNQLDLFMKKHGHFHAMVSDTVKIRRKKADVTYRIVAGETYLLRKIEFSTKDTVLLPLLPEITSGTLLLRGNSYDEDVFEKERDRITNLLKNRGFYSFNKNFITYNIDTTVGGHQSDLYVYLNRLNENAVKTRGELPEYHLPFTFRDIYIQSDFDPKNPSSELIRDTLLFKDLRFVSKTGIQTLRSQVMSNCIFFRKGDLYNQQAVNYSYQRIQNLNVFKYINIGFKEVPRDSLQREHLLDGYLQLSAMARQDFTVEADATNTGGNLGLAGSFGYRNKSLFRGAEVLEFKIKGGVQSLPNFSDSTIEKKVFFFNTYELGPELSLQFKNFLLPEFIYSSERARRMIPRTMLTAGYNLQDRPDYRRSILKLGMMYTWRTTPTKSFAFSPMEINSVYVKKSAAFQAQLDSLRDPQLQYSYDTHLISAMRFSYVYAGQANNPKRFFYLRASFESAGLLLRKLANPLNLNQNDEGIYEFVGIPFSQYVKPEIDASFHHSLNKNSSLIYRVNAGVGIPYGNAQSLPFEKSYFVGGANSMRAWIAYTLGPGSYVNNQGIEQSGDIKLESNIEYRSFLLRFMGTGSIESAVFTDIGNIWTLNEDANRPGAQFDKDLLLRDIAVGSGLGLRFNFTFFILRLDLAVKMRDPGLPAEQRWVYPNHKFVIGDVTPNLAIGYPF